MELIRSYFTIISMHKRIFCKGGMVYIENSNELLKINSEVKHLTQFWQIWQNEVQDEKLECNQHWSIFTDVTHTVLTFNSPCLRSCRHTNIKSTIHQVMSHDLPTKAPSLTLGNSATFPRPLTPLNVSKRGGLSGHGRVTLGWVGSCSSPGRLVCPLGTTNH